MSAQVSLVEWKKLRFVIMDAPKANNLHLYIRELKKQNVVCVVRVCEPTYPAAEVEAAGIKVKSRERQHTGLAYAQETKVACVVLLLVCRMSPSRVAIRVFLTRLRPPGTYRTTLAPRSIGMSCHFQLMEMEYDDGGAPPLEIINKWLDVVQTTFHDAPDSSGPNGSEGPTIAVHCVAGLGRAPVLVAIALIEYGKVSGVEGAKLKRE